MRSFAKIKPSQKLPNLQYVISMLTVLGRRGYPETTFYFVIFRRHIKSLELIVFSILINPFKPNEISHFYHLDRSMFVLRVVWWYFTFFIQILIEHSVSKLWRPYDQALRCVGLILICTVCLCPTKKARRVWFIKTSMELSVLYFKGSQVEISRIYLFLSLNLANSADPDELPPYAEFHAGLHSLPKHLFANIQNEIV